MTRLAEAEGGRSALRSEYLSPAHGGGAVSGRTLALAVLVAVIAFSEKVLDVLGSDLLTLAAVAGVLALVGAIAGARYHPVRRFWWRGSMAGILVALGAFAAARAYTAIRPKHWSYEFAVVAALGSVPGITTYYLLMRKEVVHAGE